MYSITSLNDGKHYENNYNPFNCPSKCQWNPALQAEFTL